MESLLSLCARLVGDKLYAASTIERDMMDARGSRNALYSLKNIGDRILKVAKNGYRKAHWQRVKWRAPETWDGLSNSKIDTKITSVARAQLERLLQENALPYWLARVPDLKAVESSETPYFVIYYSALTWFFARLSQTRYSTLEIETAARKSYEFLINHFRDNEYGGYYWLVRPGKLPVCEPPDQLGKDLTAQAYALYAISQYALSTRDPSAQKHADELYWLIQKQYLDPSEPGYREFKARDWSISPPHTKRYHSALTASHKSFSSHVHLMEALTVYHELNNAAEVKAALGNLHNTVWNKMIHVPSYILTNVHHGNWKVETGHQKNCANFGHEYEILWMLGEAGKALGRNRELYREGMDKVFCNATIRGMDLSHGGTFLSGRLGGFASGKKKTYWVQAETLLCSLYLYRHLGASEYAVVFNRTLKWITNHQADWQRGEWHHTLDRMGILPGDRTDKWKSPYHTGRAVLHSLLLLDELEAP